MPASFPLSIGSVAPVVTSTGIMGRTRLRLGHNAVTGGNGGLPGAPWLVYLRPYRLALPLAPR
jgi:hypothetical protein